MVRKFRSQLSLKSLIVINAFVSLGSTLVLTAIALLSAAYSSDAELDIILKILWWPFGSLIWGVLSALLAYPFYRWYCQRYKGLEVTGYFVEETDG